MPSGGGGGGPPPPPTGAAAPRLPLRASEDRRDFLAEIKAISDMEKTPLSNMSKTITMMSSICERICRPCQEAFASGLSGWVKLRYEDGARLSLPDARSIFRNEETSSWLS